MCNFILINNVYRQSMLLSQLGMPLRGLGYAHAGNGTYFILTLKMVSPTLKMVSRHFCSTLWTFWSKMRTFENFEILKKNLPLKWSPRPLKWSPDTFVQLCGRFGQR